MTIETVNNGLRNVTVLKADKANNKVLVRIGYEDILLGDTIYLGASYYIGGEPVNPPHIDTVSDFTEIDAPPDYYVIPQPDEPEISDSEAIRIITGE